MTVKVTKPAINVREELADLRKPSGTAGEAMLRAETIIQQAALLGVAPNNIIKNGAMAVNQRGSTSVVSDGANKITYGTDRFRVNSYAMSLVDYTLRQTADGPDGFSNCLEVEIDTVESVAASDLIRIQHFLEGLDIQGLAWGTSAAKPLTLQFWAKTNQTGTYAMYGHTPEGSTVVNFNYTINQPNIWQKVVWVIPPLTSAAPNDDSTIGLELQWLLTAGSNFTSGGKQPNWTSIADTKIGHGHNVDFGGTDANYFRLTGVQATIGAFPEGVPFQHRSYGEELALCQRYFQKQSASGSSVYERFGMGFSNTSTNFNTIIPIQTPMRATPALGHNGTMAHYHIYHNAGTTTPLTGISIDANADGGSKQVGVNAAVSSGLVAGGAGMLNSNNNATAFISLDAEL